MSTHKMPGLLEVDCRRCGRRHALSAEQVRVERVVRCPCGQFIRMDRALPERRSEPVPSGERPLPPDADEEQTRTLASRAAASVMSGAARATQVSLSGHERSSQPPRAAPPAPSRSSNAPPSGDKPLWYVDLGGAETVEMTIEQLIIARRSGKLGEGALVWRTGMPRWRPVGELIPTSAARPSPPPPPPAPPPVNAQRRPPDSPGAALGSYERPLATLEFALESPAPAAPREPSKLTSGSLLSRLERPSQPPRAPTPVPRRPSPAPQRLATPLPPVPIPPATPVLRPLAISEAVTTPPARSVLSTAPVTLPFPRPDHTELFSEAPRWRTVSLALLLSIGASGSGAFLVRALRSHHQPAALAPSASTLPATAFAGPSTPPAATVQAAATAEPAPPRVVDLSSLSVEHSAPRAQPRAALVTPAKVSESAESAGESESTEPAASTAPKPKEVDLFAAERASAREATDNNSVKKPVAASGDAPGL